MKYIYLTETQDGFFYVGKHSWPGATIDPDYHGSGSRLREHPIKSTILLEDTTSISIEDHNSREVYWITFYASLLGVAPFHSAEWYSIPFSKKYSRPDGRLLNCHASQSPDVSNPVWFVDAEGPYTISDLPNVLDNKGVISGWVRIGKPDSFYFHDIHIHKEGCSGGPCIKTNAEVFVSDWKKDVARSNRSHMTHQSHVKAAQTRKQNGSYQKNNAKLQAAAHTREALEKRSCTLKAKRIKYTNGEFTGDFEDIAHYVGYTGARINNVDSYLKGKLPIPAKWAVIKTFHAL